MPGGFSLRLSNWYASRALAWSRIQLVVLFLPFALLLGGVHPAAAQVEAETPTASSEHPAASVGKFLAGGALGLVAHESGHLLFDGLFDADVSIKKVSFHGLPFFAITHQSGLPPWQEFVIDSAGFWMQHAGSEIKLSKRPQLQREHAPLLKGVLAFNVLASVAYAGAAFAETGPEERDTRGMADAIGWKEPVIGALVLAPAILDAVRYFKPDAKWARWSSRGVKVGLVLLVVRAK